MHPKTLFEWWVPPGGGVEDTDNSILDCVTREVFEETGTKVKVNNKPLFIREFADKENNTLNLELFIGATFINGELTIENIYGKGIDVHYIKEVKWSVINEFCRV
ncbi:MAG: NUDIX hydrolase [Spirochaetales bacterium]|nr:NUDIX hydrolase [Spirochaetales bacterium]